MSWVKQALEGLSRMGSAKIRPHGGSMRGRIESGQLVTLVSASFDDVVVNDVVLVRWKGAYLLHLVVDKGEARVLIGNSLGKINGWAPAAAVLAKVAAVEA